MANPLDSSGISAVTFWGSTDTQFNASGFQAFRTFRADSARVYNTLRQAQVDANTYLAAAAWKLDAAVASAAQGSLDLVTNYLRKLSPTDGELTQQVLRGEKTPADWQKLADLAQAALTDVLTNVGASLPTWDRLNAEVIKPTTRQVIEEVQHVADLAGQYTPFLIAGIAAAVVLTLIIVLR